MSGDPGLPGTMSGEFEMVASGGNSPALGSLKGSLYKVLREYAKRMYPCKPKLKCMLKNVSMYLNLMLDSNFFGLTVVKASCFTVPPTMSSGF